jgi:uncharacterized protein (TIGR02147 family)
MPSSETHVEIFQYEDFRTYLKDVVADLKRSDTRFSHRFFLKKIGASSSGWLADILSARISLTDRYIPRIAQALGLGQRESDFFESLVRFNQSSSLEERKFHLDKLIAYKEIRAEVIGSDRMDFYSEWWHAAIRELLACTPVDQSAESLAEKLTPGLDAEDVVRSIELLKSLKLIRKDAQGKYKPVNVLLKKDKSTPSPHLRKYLRDLSMLAMESLERHPKTERDVSTMTLALGKESFEEVVLDLRALRKKILERAANDSAPNKVYQLNIQFFPLSK